jgi:hypothetical protein
MLSTPELLLNSFVALLLPLAIYSLLTGALPNPKTWLGRLYRMDRVLPVVSDLFLIMVCAASIVRLALHIGFITDVMRDRLEPVINVPFLVLLVLFLALLTRAFMKLRRTPTDPADV